MFILLQLDQSIHILKSEYSRRWWRKILRDRSTVEQYKRFRFEPRAAWIHE